MLSRVADAVYWASRYVERAENVARFIDVNLNLAFDSPGKSARPTWEPLVFTSGDQAWFMKKYGDPTPEAVTQFLTFDRDYPNSIITSLMNARENLRVVRHIISREMWQHLNNFYWMVVDASSHGHAPEDMVEFYNQVKLLGNYFEGITDATLSRGPAWHFMRLGRMIERADKTSRILDVKYFILLPTVRDIGTNLDHLGWAALLSSASALQMYRQVYHVTNPQSVAAFLVLDGNFPRAIHFCVVQAQESLHALTGTPMGTYQNEAERLLGQLRARLDYTSIGPVMEQGLHEFLDSLQCSLNDIGTAIHRLFFEVGV